MIPSAPKVNLMKTRAANHKWHINSLYNLHILFKVSLSILPIVCLSGVS